MKNCSGSFLWFGVEWHEMVLDLDMCLLLPLSLGLKNSLLAILPLSCCTRMGALLFGPLEMQPIWGFGRLQHSWDKAYYLPTRWWWCMPSWIVQSQNARIFLYGRYHALLGWWAYHLGPMIHLSPSFECHDLKPGFLKKFIPNVFFSPAFMRLGKIELISSSNIKYQTFTIENKY